MNSKELPSDLVLEILTRVTSLETLDTCRSVCQSWDKLIHDPKFMPLFYQRIKSLSGYFIHDKSRQRCLTPFVFINQLQDAESSSSSSSSMERLLPDGFRILASCDQGIVFCLRSNGYYYVCKPATRQWRPLPFPIVKHPTASIAIMVLSSSPLRYKIVRLSLQGNQENYLGWFLQLISLAHTNQRSIKKYKCEVFDSKFWTWKETQDINLPCTEFIDWSSTTVSTSNSIYWLTSENNVLTFHEPQETFNKFQLPKEVVNKKEPHKYKKLMEYKGGLGLIICNLEKKGDTELWLTHKNSRNSTLHWMDKMVIDKENNIVRSTITHPSYVGFYNDAIEFLKVFYDTKPKCTEDCIWAKSELIYGRDFFRFWSDLEPVDHLGRREINGNTSKKLFHRRF